jgi:diguanylate cyclase (GGDEF)-like protein
MDYPVLVNRGKPPGRLMKKKTRRSSVKVPAGAETVKSRLAKPQPAKSKSAKPKSAKPKSAKPKLAKTKSVKSGKHGGRASKSAVPRGQQRAARPPAVPNDKKPAVQRLRAQLAQAQAQIDELQASAETDFLLEIPNRRGFERELHRSISYIKRYQATGALIMLDVDRLKPINDALGHAAGDQVLKAIVGALLDHVRASDVIGRLGGDEFALLLWNLSETDARAKAALLEQTIDQLTIELEGGVVTAGISAGFAMLGPDADPVRALQEADRAMYERKAQRRPKGN